MGKFVMVDGLDGAGKGVAVNALREWAEAKEMKVLDLREYWKSNQGFPDVSDYDVIISAEPTFTGIGKKIREKLIKNGSQHSVKEIAEAFSQDRKELYEKLILPALEKGKYVFQERGITSSLVFQPTMGDPKVDVEFIKNLEGNKFCLEHAPDLLVFVLADPKVVIERASAREKQDDAIFEKVEFQKKIKTVFESNWLRELFESKGSKVAYLNTNPPGTPEDTKKKIIEIFESVQSS